MNKNWLPTASFENLKLRALITKKIRSFFEERNVLEVETPLISHSTVTDPALFSFETDLIFNGCYNKQKFYLQTSPEFAMKRLLAAGSGCIYQICKAFRNGESGKKHNPEFTILEWYRVGFTHFDLMDEMDEFLQHLLMVEKADRISYTHLFKNWFGINPNTVSIDELRIIAEKHDIKFNKKESIDRDLWLDLLLTHIIEPELGHTRPVYIYDYPETQAALARLKTEGNYRVGERFEVYYKSMELANGYHELAEPKEQVRRFNQDNKVRQLQGLPIIPLDTHFINALNAFPHCSGVALGLDRLICLALQVDTINEVIAFPISNA